ncbi:exonuclease [Yasminevirus sp. GU-2018]|uniref:Exonuclease n=1 Tax=Yasminevirus sp. GU-2018 TaxID=2420051 RepID=A0A5K0U8G6_9VIRU|nr:exonuclease [Yasminevirus sp. GU-2018]
MANEKREDNGDIEECREERFICVLDFEATCWENSNDHEIIEFPSVLLKWRQTTDSKGKTSHTVKEISRIQTYVKPKINPSVSKFCLDLTGITQDTVNKGVPLKTAIRAHEDWLREHCGDDFEQNTTIVTCGNWDLQTMLPMDLKKTGLKTSKVYSKWVNIKEVFALITKTHSVPMVPMLKHFGLNLEGRHHSGIDDCHNIARIFTKLVESGLKMSVFDAFVKSNKQ